MRAAVSVSQKQSSIKTRFVVQSTAIILMMMCLIGMIVMVRISINDILHTHEKTSVCQLLANELRQSSEDLSNNSRMFVVSGGNDIYSNEYDDILAWRSGRAPRPSNLAENLFPGETINMMDLLKRVGFTEEELVTVETSLVLSD